MRLNKKEYEVKETIDKNYKYFKKWKKLQYKIEFQRKRKRRALRYIAKEVFRTTYGFEPLENVITEVIKMVPSDDIYCNHWNDAIEREIESRYKRLKSKYWGKDTNASELYYEVGKMYPEQKQEEEANGYFYGPYDYTPLIESFGEILIRVDDLDYQGDSRILYKKNNKYGFLVFGWGSCSGCDALQSCGTMKDIEDLRSSLEKNIEWFPTLEELQTRVKNKDWELDYSWHCEETKDFIKQVLAYGKDTSTNSE